MEQRTGLILAAGYGSRLAGSVSETDFKPLTPVNGTPLIFRTIRSLELAGCSRVGIVLGYGAEKIKDRILSEYEGDLPLDFIVNDKYHLQNGVSVLAAKDYAGSTFVLTMADHIIGDELMTLASEHHPPSNGATLLVDYKLDSIFDMDDATKVQTDSSGNIETIGKQLQEYNCVDTGVFICTSGLIDALQEFYEAHGDASLSQGVQHLAKSGRMTTLDIGAGYWQDVDTPEMLEQAEQTLAASE